MLVNLAIAITKAIADVLTSSAAILSETAHSVADTFTEALLLTALRRSDHPADRRHPFASGAMFAFYEGFRTVLGEPEEQTRPLVG